MSDIIIDHAEEEDNGKRLDLFLTQRHPDLSRSAVQKIITSGMISVNFVPAGAKHVRIKTGDTVSFREPEPVSLDVLPEDIPLDIRYEDKYLLVVNKPKGMVVHPAAGNYTGTLVNALLYYCKNDLSGINGVIRPGIVHRIDKDTSGLLIVAKTDLAHLRLSSQIKDHTFGREYQAVVYGHLKEPEGTVDAPIGRHPTQRKRMAVTDRHSRNAVTHYSLVEEYASFSHIALKLETGRTHQIRVHMAYIGHPVAGDPVYGPKKVITSLNGQCLHAGYISFVHPVSGQTIEVTAELPDYFTSFLRGLNK